MAGISTTSQLNSSIRLLTAQQTQLNNLATQLSTGKKTQVNSGLGNDLISSLRARTSLSSNSTYQNNITHADRKMQLMLQTTSEIKAQSEVLSGQAILFSKESVHQKGEYVTYDNPLTTNVETTRVGMTSADPSVEFETLQDLASNLYNIVTNLINVQDGDNYLLNGADVSTKPLNDNGLLESSVESLITQWKDGTITSEELIADLQDGDTSSNPDAITDATIGFTANLSADNVGDVSVRASENIEIDYTIKANEDPFRDVLVALAFLKSDNLGPIADTYIPPNAPPAAPDVQGAPGMTVDAQKDAFFTVFGQVQEMAANAIDGIDSINARVETSRARMSDISDGLVQSEALLNNIVADVENVDMERVAVEVSSLQVQLQASYTVTASVQQLSLVNFI